MLSTLLGIVVALLILGVILWGIQALPWIDPTIKSIIRVIVIVIVAIWCIVAVAGLFGVHMPVALR